MKNGTIHDVAVIGASAAGALACHTLASRGLRVVIIDKAGFPRRKPCGEGLSASGFRILEEGGFSDEIRSLQTVPFESYGIWHKNNLRVLHPGENGIAGAGIERFDLDHALNQKFLGLPNVTCLYETAVQHITQDEKGVRVTANSQEIRARYLILADGAHSSFARRLRIPCETRAARRYSVTLWMEGTFAARPRLMQILLKPNLQICCTALPRNRLNVSILGAKPFIAETRSKQFRLALRHELREKIDFEGEVIESALGSGPFGTFLRKAAHHKVLLAGDVCEQLDPLGGMGITHAFLSGSLAAQAVIRVLCNSEDEAKTFAWYQQQRARETRPLRGFTRLSYFSLVPLRDAFFSSGIYRSELTGYVKHAVHGHTENSSPGSTLARHALSLLGTFP